MTLEKFTGLSPVMVDSPVEKNMSLLDTPEFQNKISETKRRFSEAIEAVGIPEEPDKDSLL